MTNCNNIKRLIDEAEQPELLPFEATHHLNACAPCRQFADERTSLRGLLNQMPRVNAPVNFDAQLKARITTAKAPSSLAWLSPALYLRFGAVTAVLVVGVFVAQYNGIFSQSNNLISPINTPQDVTPNSAPGGAQSESLYFQTPGNDGVNPKTATPTTTTSSTFIATSGRGNGRVRPVPVKLDDDAMPGRVPNFIVRDKDRREVELPMLPVSLGAQQQLINRSSRSSVQPIAISF